MLDPDFTPPPSNVRKIVLALTLAVLGLVVNSTSTQTLAYTTESYVLKNDSTSANAKLFYQYMNAGYAATKKKDYKTALTNFKKALSLRPGDRYATQAIRNVEKYLVALPKSRGGNTSQSRGGNTSHSRGGNTSGLARKLLEKYLDDIINKGYSGTTYWCSQSKQFESSFFAPKSARILDFSEFYDKKKKAFAIATIQLESTNQGGIPIRANWDIYMEKERKPETAKLLPGGWCISSIGKKN